LVTLVMASNLHLVLLGYGSNCVVIVFTNRWRCELRFLYLVTHAPLLHDLKPGGEQIAIFKYIKINIVISFKVTKY